MGRARIKMELIGKERSRNATFLKRKKGLIKKAHEFSILCGIDVCMFIYGPKTGDNPTGQVEIWPENPDEVKRIVNKFHNTRLDERERRTHELSNYFEDRQKKVLNETAKLRKKNREENYTVSDEFLETLTEDQLGILLGNLDEKIEMVRNYAAPYFLQQETIGTSYGLHNFNPCHPGLYERQTELGFYGHQQPIPPLINVGMQLPMSHPSDHQQQSSFTHHDVNPVAMILANSDDNMVHYGGASSSGGDNMNYNFIRNPFHCEPSSSILDNMYLIRQGEAPMCYSSMPVQHMAPPQGLYIEDDNGDPNNVRRFLQ